MSSGLCPRLVGVGLLGALLGVGLGGCTLDSRERALARGDYGHVDDRGDLGGRIDDSRKLRLPDLRPRPQTPNLPPGTDDVQIQVRVRNIGDGHADSFLVAAQVTIPVPGSQPRVLSFPPVRFPDLDPGEETWAYIGTVRIASADRPTDIAIEVTADPPTPANPRGEVLERDESNNVRTFTARIP